MRHDNIRDTVAYFFRKAKCKDVRDEPPLLSVNALNFKKLTHKMKPHQTFQQWVRSPPLKKTRGCQGNTPNCNCDTNVFKALSQIHKEHKKVKKDAHE